MNRPFDIFSPPFRFVALVTVNALAVQRPDVVILVTVVAPITTRVPPINTFPVPSSVNSPLVNVRPLLNVTTPPEISRAPVMDVSPDVN